MNASQIGKKLNRHTVFQLACAGVDAYAAAYGDCTTVTAHEKATVALRENAGRVASAKLSKTDKVLVFGLDKAGKIIAGLSYVRFFGLTEIDAKGDVYARKQDGATVRGSIAAVAKIAGKANAQLVSRATAQGWIDAILKAKSACIVWQSVGVNRNGKSVALAMDDAAQSGLVTRKA